jgi:hypothetical protein
MVLTKQHFRMIAQHAACDRIVILGGDRQHDAAAAQVQGQPLHRAKGFSDRIAFGDLDAFQAIITNHTTPKRVVEVQHQATTRLTAHCTQ